MIARFSLVALGLMLAIAACNTGGTTNPPPPVSGTGCNISISGFSYSNADCKIKVGDKVTLPAQASHPLLGAGEAGNPVSATDAVTANTEFTFSKAGTYVYFCKNHGSPTGGMKGTITVE